MAPIPECIGRNPTDIIESGRRKKEALDSFRSTARQILSDTATTLQGAGMDPEKYTVSHLAVDPTLQSGRAAHLVIAIPGINTETEYYAVGARPSPIEGKPYGIELYRLQIKNSGRELHWQVTAKEEVVYYLGKNLIPLQRTISTEITGDSLPSGSTPELVKTDLTAKSVVRAAETYAQGHNVPSDTQGVMVLDTLSMLLQAGIGSTVQKKG